MKFLKFFIMRTITFVLIILIGMTAVFFLPRLMPSDPVETMLSQILAESSSMSSDAVEAMREVLTQNFGLEGTLWQQYTSFLGRVIFTQDFGPSLSNYPTPVIELIGKALPWTIGLMMTSMIISWFIGNFVGLLAGFRKEKRSSKILEGISVGLYPIPYYVLALALIMVFAYIIPIFPITTNVRGEAGSWEYIKNLLYNSILPALSIIMINIGGWALTMKTLTIGVVQEDYVTFAKMKGLSDRKIMWSYVMPNATLPQVTGLAIKLSQVFCEAMVVEILFNYPGIGTLIYKSVLAADYNMIMGTISMTILVAAVTTYIVDIAYPLLDPRIRQN